MKATASTKTATKLDSKKAVTKAPEFNPPPTEVAKAVAKELVPKKGKQVDPNEETQVPIDVVIKFNMKFLKGTPQEERIRAIADYLASQSPEWYLELAFLKPHCTNMTDHASREKVWDKRLGYPTWRKVPKSQQIDSKK